MFEFLRYIMTEKKLSIQILKKCAYIYILINFYKDAKENEIDSCSNKAFKTESYNLSQDVCTKEC